MLEFFPVRLHGIDIDLLALAGIDAELSAQFASNDVPYDPASEDHPFIQLSYDEVDQEELDRILAYAEIVEANRPLGLPYEFATITAPSSDGPDWRLYSLSGLNDHLRSIDPGLFKMRDRCDSLEELLESLDSHGKHVTGEQYLVLTLVEAIDFCNSRSIGLATHW